MEEGKRLRRMLAGLTALLCLLCYEKASGFLNWLFFDTVSALLPQQLG